MNASFAPPVVAAATGGEIDRRLIFLERASARLILFHEGLMTLAEAFDGLVDTLSCPCSHEMVERWERDYPPPARRPKKRAA